jgi:hypothetical protein
MKDGTKVLPKNRKLLREIESCWGRTEPPAVAGGLEMAEWPAPDLEIGDFAPNVEERSRNTRGCASAYRRRSFRGV